MELKIECPWCHQHYSVDESFVGQNVECSVCGKEFVVKYPNNPVPELTPPKNISSNRKKVDKPIVSQNHVSKEKTFSPKKNIRKWVIVFAALAIVLISLCVFYYVKVFPDKEYKKGLDAYNEHRYTEAVEHLKKAAENGYPEAQLILGLCCYNGDGIIKNSDEAVLWFRRAAEQNNIEAQYRMGLCYQVGVGVNPREDEAFFWFQKAATNGHAEAQFNLGMRYFNGNGVTKDYTEAVKWLRLSSEQGVVGAKDTLPIAEMHLEAQNGDAKAQFNLGRLYENGYGVTKDPILATSWYRKAAEQDYVEAQYNLGKCYERGRGVTSDLVEAVKMYSKAAKQGHAEAKEILTYLGPVDDSSGATGVKVIIPGGESFAMIRVESGSFEMSALDGENKKDEVPHQVVLKHDFYIGQTEVTQAQWKTVMGSNPSEYKGDNLPVENVSWNEAMEFCEQLNTRNKTPDGWKFTLPTETQWEYAARGGKKSNGYKYSGSNAVDEVAWCEEGRSNFGAHPVGQKKANELGLYDMSGNVCEWCLDDWQDKSDKLIAEFWRRNDRTGDNKRACRGGCAGRGAWGSRSATRDYGYIEDPFPDPRVKTPLKLPPYRMPFLGFRVVLVPVQ